MPVEVKTNKIIFFEEPRQYTFGDLLLSLYGSAMVGFCVYSVYNPFDNVPPITFIGLGLLHVYFALIPVISIYSAAETGVFDSDSRKMIIEERSIFGNSTKEFDFSEIKGVQIAQDFDPDRPDGWHLEIGLKNGEEFEIPHTFSRSRQWLEPLAETVNTRLKSLNS